MKVIGVIAEYNPFHYGHLYHLKEIKRQEEDSLIIGVISTTFTERGIPSYLDKYTKTKLCLDYGIDLVIELPFPFASQSADYFAKGAISILSLLGVQELYFGSESNDVEALKRLSQKSLDFGYQEKVKQYMKEGENYPSALNDAFEDEKKVTTPNDLLGLSYIKEIIRQKSSIEPKTILRTNDYHSETIASSIASASSIRKAIREKTDFSGTVPSSVVPLLKEKSHFEEDYFPIFKYKVLSSKNLAIYQTVDEGIEHRIKKVILEATSFEDFIEKMKTKRYTYNRLRRMCVHILCGFTKEMAKAFQEISYLRILGFTKKGQQYLNQKKKEIPVPLITKLSKQKPPMLAYEEVVFSIYSSVFPIEKQIALWKSEYRDFPIRKESD